MIQISDEKLCCGCAACMAICPVNCITMQERTLGCVFPKVEEKKCIACKMCEKVCPFHYKIYTNNYIQKAYAAYALNEIIRLKSSSGGMFYILAKELLKQEYCVYGATFVENLKLKTIAADNLNQLFPLMKSKYIQSDISQNFIQIKEKLQNGKKIMFIGTPCQVTAIKAYLRKEYEYLITVDFFCHGVPSQSFFDTCIDFDNKKNKYRIKKFEFRTKVKNGVTPHYFTIEYERNNKNFKKTDFYFRSTFYIAFQKYICLRESCYACKFASMNRASDITIGDFHDIDKYINDVNRFDGISMVIINTKKGQGLFDLCQKDLKIYKMNIKNMIVNKTCFTGGTKKPINRNEFVQFYTTQPFKKVVDKFMNPKSYYKQIIYYKSPKFLRELLKKLIIGE